MTKETLIKYIKDNVPANHKGRYFGLMLFKTEIELHISNTPNKWVNTENHVFTNEIEALDAYSNIPNPASQLVDADTPEELVDKMTQMIDNFNNLEWLETELYPYM